jgi:hypothetical protein
MCDVFRQVQAVRQWEVFFWKRKRNQRQGKSKETPFLKVGQKQFIVKYEKYIEIQVPPVANGKIEEQEHYASL